MWRRSLGNRRIVPARIIKYQDAPPEYNATLILCDIMCALVHILSAFGAHVVLYSVRLYIQGVRVKFLAARFVCVCGRRRLGEGGPLCRLVKFAGREREAYGYHRAVMRLQMIYEYQRVQLCSSVAVFYCSTRGFARNQAKDAQRTWKTLSSVRTTDKGEPPTQQAFSVTLTARIAKKKTVILVGPKEITTERYHVIPSINSGISFSSAACIVVFHFSITYTIVGKQQKSFHCETFFVI